jgi:hypothetical protein
MRYDAVDPPFEGSDYFNVVMRVGRPLVELAARFCREITIPLYRYNATYN